MRNCFSNILIALNISDRYVCWSDTGWVPQFKYLVWSLIPAWTKSRKFSATRAKDT